MDGEQTLVVMPSVVGIVQAGIHQPEGVLVWDRLGDDPWVVRHPNESSLCWEPADASSSGLALDSRLVIGYTSGCGMLEAHGIVFGTVLIPATRTGWGASGDRRVPLHPILALTSRGLVWAGGFGTWLKRMIVLWMILLPAGARAAGRLTVEDASSAPAVNGPSARLGGRV
jgi:hypothetical protein